MWTIFNDDLDRIARQMWDRQKRLAEGLMSADELAEHQLAQLRRTLRHAAAGSPFYRERLAGIDPDRIDLSPTGLAQIPPTTKQDLRAAQYDILSAPLPRARIFYETTGTTGRATPCPRDAVDMLANDLVLTAHYDTILWNLGQDQFIGVSGPTEVHAFGDTFGDVCHNLDLAVVKLWPHSPMVGFERAIELLRAIPVTGLFCTPGMALTLAKEATARGLDPQADFDLRVLLLTGELVSDSLLAQLGRIWGADAYNALYASQEASVLGAACADGLMYTAPLTNLYEVLEPDGETPAQPDARGVREGELVVTSLYQGAKPLIRYRTGDLVRLRPPGPDAAIGVDSLEVLGRVADALQINGRRISGLDLESLLLREARGYLDYQILLDGEPGHSLDGAAAVDRLTLTLHPQPGRDPVAELAATGTAEAVRRRLGAGLTVRAGTLDAITSTGAMVSWKAARIVDRRPAPGVAAQERDAALALAAVRGAR